MQNYTRKYVNQVSLLLTILVFLCYLIFMKQYKQERQRNEILENTYTKPIYYNVIPIKRQHKRQMIDMDQIAKQKKIEKVEEIYPIVPKSKIVKQSQNDTNEKKSKLKEVDFYQTNPWRIKIPKLRVDAPITEGTNAESLRRTVGHFEETNKWDGNVALAGHNRGYRCNFFQEIKKLQIGDEIIYQTEKGKRKYRVILNKIILETNWKYIQNTKENKVTLITCEENKREYRRCIQAVEV